MIFRNVAAPWDSDCHFSPGEGTSHFCADRRLCLAVCSHRRAWRYLLAYTLPSPRKEHQEGMLPAASPGVPLHIPRVALQGLPSGNSFRGEHITRRDTHRCPLTTTRNPVTSRSSLIFSHSATRQRRLEVLYVSDQHPLELSTGEKSYVFIVLKGTGFLPPLLGEVEVSRRKEDETQYVRLQRLWSGYFQPKRLVHY